MANLETAITEGGTPVVKKYNFRAPATALDALRLTLAQPAAPPAVLKPQCDGCSLRGVCLPEATALRRARLFEPRDY